MYRVLWLIVTPIFSWLVLALVGVDKFTTLSNTAPSWVIFGGWALVSFWVALRAYLINVEPTARIERLKRDSKPAWIAAGILSAVLMAGISGFSAGRLVQTAAQYLPGERRQVSGEVTDVQQHVRSACRQHATVLSNPTETTMRICVKVTMRAAIGPLDLAPGERVTIQLKDTWLGTVALQMRRDL